jgi:hypothetical protein
MMVGARSGVASVSELDIATFGIKEQADRRMGLWHGQM